MKQKLLLLIVLIQEKINGYTSFICKLSGLTAFLLVILSGSSSAQMVQQWNVFASTEGSTAQRFSDSALDADGNVYLLGSQDSPGSEHTMTLMKYDAKGQKLWHRKLENFQYSTSEFPITLKVGKNGDVYVLALYYPTTGGQGMLFYKVSPEGNTQWIRPYGYRLGSIDRAYDFMLSEDDDLYVAGFHSSTQGHDMFALKYNKAGNMEWEKRLDNMRGHSTYGPTLALDPAGDPYIAVRARIFSQDVEAYPLLIKLDRASGQVIATKKYTEPEMGGGSTDPRRLHINPEGMVYMVSQQNGAILVSKADATGEIRWAKRETADGSYLGFWDMAVDAEENLILSTWPHSTYLFKYTKDGERAWMKQYKTGVGRSVAVDANGNIAVTGGFLSLEAQRYYMMLAQYNKHGERLLEELYDSAEPIYKEGEILRFDKQGNLYLSGSGRAGGVDKIIAIKYVAAPSACDIPVAVNLNLPPNGQQVGKPVSAKAMLEADKLPATISARWTWGDGTSAKATHKPGDTFVTGEHTYSSVGIYTVGLDLGNTCLKPTSEDYTQQLAIFDPNAGFVTGSGWFQSTGVPEAIPGKAEKVQFDVNIKYQQQGEGALMPTGSTSFQFSDQLRFESTSYDWLVVKDDKAVWQGAGQINGQGNFGFMVSVMDAGEGSGKKKDLLRVRIWDKSQGNKLYYDSFGQNEGAYFLPDQGPAIGGGNIVIHRKGNLKADKKNSVLAGQEAGTTKELIAYPNPFVNTTTLQFELKEQGSYTLALYDLKGALVQELKKGNAQANELVEVQVNASALPKGMYMARLVTDNEVRSVKVIVQK